MDKQFGQLTSALFQLIHFSSVDCNIFFFAFSSGIQVPLTVYYESLCPDSVRFIVDQLHPVKQSPLGRYIDVTLIPFGKASVSIVWTNAHKFWIGKTENYYLFLYRHAPIQLQRKLYVASCVCMRACMWHSGMVVGFTVANYRYEKDNTIIYYLSVHWSAIFSLSLPLSQTRANGWRTPKTV